MSIVRVGSNKKYAEGWELIFGGGKGSRKGGASKSRSSKSTRSTRKTSSSRKRK